MPRILALSDQVVDFVYSPAVRPALGDVDLIVGCGDLPAAYLEYVVTQLNCPLVYVPGNHDADDYDVPGGQSIDGSFIRIGGITLAGLGGSQRYKRDGAHQYTEGEMMWRVVRLSFALSPWRLARGRGLDVFVTHSPPLGIQDDDDLAHRGFGAFRTFVETMRPRLMLHGHAHIHPNIDASTSVHAGTRIINVFPYRVVELEMDR